jgi:hypothetical protein
MAPSMAELVDAQVSKTCSLGSVGSIPTARTSSRGSRLSSIRDPISYGHPGMTSPGEDAYAGSVSRPVSASSLKPPAL